MAVVIALIILFCVSKSAKRNMLKHILKGTAKTVSYFKEICLVQQTTIERE